MANTVAKLFGEIAVERGFCTREQVEEALSLQREARGKAAPRPLGAMLHELGHLSLVDINKITELVDSAKRRRSIEGFDVMAKLGSGAMSTVYLARQVSLDKLVALKVLPKKLAQDPDALKRFKREALATARLNHPGIMQAYNVGESNGFHYLVMEYIQGETLKQLLEREKRMDEPHTVNLALKMAAALAHAAEHRIVHRDVKPANIMLTRAGEPKLCDLGLAVSKRGEDGSVTRDGVIMGTPFYLSPEQARGEELDERSDLYSLGATLFHAATGQVPFDGDSAASIVARHLADPPPDPRSVVPELSAELAAVILRMLAKERTDRYQSCEELLADLHELTRTGRLASGSHTESGRLRAAAIRAGEAARASGEWAGGALAARGFRVGKGGAALAACLGAALGVGLLLLLEGEDALLLVEARLAPAQARSAEAQAPEIARVARVEARELRAAGRYAEARALLAQLAKPGAGAAERAALEAERERIDEAARERFAGVRAGARALAAAGDAAGARKALEAALELGVDDVTAAAGAEIRALDEAAAARPEAIARQADRDRALERAFTGAAQAVAAGDLAAAAAAVRAEGRESHDPGLATALAGFARDVDALAAAARGVEGPVKAPYPVAWISANRLGSPRAAARLRGLLCLLRGDPPEARAALEAASATGEDVSLYLGRIR